MSLTDALPPIGELTVKDRRQVRAQLDSDHVRSACGERGGRLSGAGADLGDSGARSDLGQLGEVIDQLGWVLRASSVVQLGVLIEDRAQVLRRHVEASLLVRPSSDLPRLGQDKAYGQTRRGLRGAAATQAAQAGCQHRASSLGGR